MPKLKQDDALHARLQEFVRACDGVPARAAEALGLSPVFIWRFHRTGTAIERNRNALRQALDRMEQSGDIEADGSAKRKNRNENEIPKQEIAQLRRMLHHLLNALDRDIEGRA